MGKPITVAALSGSKSPRRSYQPSDQFVLPDQHIGIELEMEGVSDGLDMTKTLFWETDREDSLRDRGAEIILSEPLSGHDLHRALEELPSLFSENTEAIKSRRGSTHIHLDARNLTVEQATGVMMLATVLEPYLFTIFGAERRFNHFCLPVEDSYHQLRAMGYARLVAAPPYESLRSTINFLRDALPKYSATSGVHLVGRNGNTEYGSIEFRQMRALQNTPEDFALLRVWINVVMCLMRTVQTTPDILSAEWFVKVSDLSVQSLLDQVFDTPMLWGRLPPPEPEHITSIFSLLRAVQDAVFGTLVEQQVVAALAKQGDVARWPVTMASPYAKGIGVSIPDVLWTADHDRQMRDNNEALLRKKEWVDIQNFNAEELLQRMVAIVDDDDGEPIGDEVEPEEE